MLPQINGKSFLECTENDFSELIENEDYRENEYIDYKQTFSFLEMPKGKERDAKKSEFKSDVCSFANAEGGYLIFGISDKKGCASSIDGIEIPNNDTDKFELDRRNDLTGIQPKVPPLQFSFIKLESERYVVVIFVKHDRFSPYVHVEDEKNYKVYKRYGNGKRVMSYTELRQMFNSSLTLEQSINEYTKNRIEHYLSLGESFGHKFLHLMLIPETFMDYSYRQNMFVIERSGRVSFGSIFSQVYCSNPSIPCVDGLRFVSDIRSYYSSEGYVRNNGVVEICLSLDGQLNRSEKYPEGFLPWGLLWNDIYATCKSYLNAFKDINTGERIYICLSIVGCRNVTTEDRGFQIDRTGRIDRNEVICEPTELLKNAASEEFELTMKKLNISFLLAIGVKHDEKIKALIDEVYGTANI